MISDCLNCGVCEWCVERSIAAACESEPEPPAKPRRAWQLELSIGADTREDLVALLESLLFDSLKRGSDSSVTGGYSSGGYFTVTHAPEWTHDRYFDQLDRLKGAE